MVSGWPQVAGEAPGTGQRWAGAEGTQGTEQNQRDAEEGVSLPRIELNATVAT